MVLTSRRFLSVSGGGTVSPSFPLKASTSLRTKLEGRFLSDTTALVMSVTPRISSLSLLAAGYSAGMRQSFAQTVIGAHTGEEKCIS